MSSFLRRTLASNKLQYHEIILNRKRLVGDRTFVDVTRRLTVANDSRIDRNKKDSKILCLELWVF